MRILIASLACGFLAPLAFGQLPPEKALTSMKAGEGLQVELFAHEPMLINPTAIDIDHKGRVWVAEAVNYRCHLFKRPLNRAEGDRIQILIDEKGEGKATKAVTFYQGPELIAPLGVCVIPQADGKALRVLVAQSPDILEFWDRDGDLKADGPPTKFLSGFGGFDHDHGVHGLSIGPDGKLYFTVGDQGVKGLQSKDGKGKSWTTNQTECQAGTVWRIDLDGKNLELIAHNFRNNYECCVDSFGEIWLSDNDDDGNQQTRICHVLPGGNYGYWPRGPGQSHWHEEQPGIVHKTLRTGFGSPTGITFYEGTLLPKQYQGDLIHCDAGPREVRYFKRKPKGAGYELEKIPMLTSSDTWFRPSAVRVAPDGSVFIADWYDPGVGGHGMGDKTRGRIFRLTPSGHVGYKTPEANFSKAGFKVTIQTRHSTTRAAVMQLLFAKGTDGDRSGILNFAKNQDDPFTKAWILDFVSHWTKQETELHEAVSTLFQSKDYRLKQLAFRIIRSQFTFPTSEGKKNGIPLLRNLEQDNILLKQLEITSRMECIFWLSVLPAEENTILAIYQIAKLYDGQDRTYLSALNIACGTDPARRDAILADFEKHFPEWNDKVADLVWELRPKSMLPKMGQLLNDTKLTPAQRARIVDILAVNDDPNAGKTVLKILFGDYPQEVKSKAIENLKLYLPTKWKDLSKSPELEKASRDLLISNQPSDVLAGLKLITFVNDSEIVEHVFKAWSAAKDETVRKEAAQTLGRIHSQPAIDKLKVMIVGAAHEKFDGKHVLAAIGMQITGRGDSDISKQALEILQLFISEQYAKDPAGFSYSVAAIEALASSRTGTAWLLKLKDDGKFPPLLVYEAGKVLRNSPFQGERNRAMQLFPVAGKLEIAKLPGLGDLAKKTGNAKNGEKLFLASAKNEMQCMKCHKVNGQGGEIGPDLSAIGIKGSKENLFESILYPSRAIADQHVSWTVSTADGVTITGLLVRETETNLTIRDANGKDTLIETKNVESKKKSLVSLMPEDLVKTLTEEELVDLVAYLGTLKAELKK